MAVHRDAVNRSIRETVTQRSTVGLTLLLSGSVPTIVGTRFTRRVSYRARPSLPHLASLRDIAPHHRESVQRNDFNEAASITSVNRARALTGDLRPVGRALMPPYNEGERHRVPREAIDKARLTSIIHFAASGDCQGDYQETIRVGMRITAFLYSSDAWRKFKKENRLGRK